jgi:hypothetical protein
MLHKKRATRLSTAARYPVPVVDCCLVSRKADCLPLLSFSIKLVCVCSTRRGQRGFRLRGTPDRSARTGQRGAITRRKVPPCAALARRQAPGGAEKLKRHPRGERGAERAAIQEWTALAARMQSVASTVEVDLYHAWRVPALPARRDRDCILLARRCCCSRSPHAERLLVVRENEAAAAVRGTAAWRQATRIARYGVRPLLSET